MSEIDFSELFKNNNFEPLIYNNKLIKLYDKWNLKSNNVKIKITFLSVNKFRKQGFIIRIDGSFDINGQKIQNQIVLWEHTAPKEFILTIESKDKKICINNAWLSDNELAHQAHFGAAMFVEESENFRVYNCNDGLPNDDFNDLIFKIEFLKM